MSNPPNQPELEDSRLAPEVAAATADPSRRIGRYVVLSELGRGGMGVVYRCWDPSLQRLVALKLILDPDHAGPEQLKRFQREGQVMARLSHPGIVQLLDVGDHNGQPFIALAFVDGKTFEDAYHHHRPSAQELAQVVAQVADALQHAHDHGVVHRDVKPGNVFIDRRGRAQLGDFGLVAVSDASTRLTRTGRAVGTPGYMAPEQLSNDLGEAGPHSDIYGLGGLLYWGLTGKDPFAGTSVTEVLRQILVCDVRPPQEANPDTHPDLNRITLRCLSKRSLHRPETAADVAKDLRRVALGEKLEHGTNSHKTHRWPVATVSLALIACAFGLVSWVWRPDDARLASDARQRHDQTDAEQLSRAQSSASAEAEAEQEATLPNQQASPPSAATLVRRGLEKLYSPTGSELVDLDVPGAIIDFTRAIEIDPDQPDAWLARGQAHMANSDLRSAISDFSHAIAIDPNLLEAWIGRGKARATLRHTKEAIEDFSRAIEVDPNHPVPWDARARQRMKIGDINGAKQDFQRYKSFPRQARSAFRSSAYSHVLEGDYLTTLRDYDAAIAAYEKALMLNPRYKLDKSNAQAWAQRGQLRLSRDDLSGAIADLTRALDIAPDLEDSWAHLGNTQMALRHWNTAIAHYTRALEIDPDDSINWANRGLANLAGGKYDQAMSDLNRAIEMDPTYPEPWSGRGSARRVTGDMHGAIADFKEFLRIAPSHQQAAEIRKVLARLRLQYPETNDSPGK